MEELPVQFHHLSGLHLRNAFAIQRHVGLVVLNGRSTRNDMESVNGRSMCGLYTDFHRQ